MPGPKVECDSLTPRRRTSALLAGVGLAAILCGCATAPETESAGPRPAARQPPAAESELVRSLVALGNAALDRGDTSVAEDRFRRALAVAPASSSVRAGLGRVALVRGDRTVARDWLESVVTSDPTAAPARVLLAQLEAEDGARPRALSLLAEATAENPLDPEAHAAYARLSGPAPRTHAPEDARAARRLARAHPYDLWAALQWAQLALDESGSSADATDTSEALDALSGRLWLADVDRRSAESALHLLREHRSAWNERRVVWVHVFADETVRRHTGWRMRLRGLWRGQNEALGPVLQTFYLPASIKSFSAATADASLASVHVAWTGSTPSWPADGILAAFTERPGPRLRGYQLGVAELLGRRLIVRLAPGEIDSRTLAHEVLHLYGAVHIRAEVDSLMNPSGASSTLDHANHRIVSLQRDRTFRGGGFARDSFPFVDAAALTDAYNRLLRVNLAFRQLGLDRALEAAETSRYYAADLASAEVALDSHFGDVASFIANLLVYQDRLVQAAFFFDGAARLYGLGTRRGLASSRRFDAIYSVLQARGTVP